MIPLLTNSPRRAFAKLSQSFYEKEGKTPKISSKSVVPKTCIVGEGCRIDPGVIVGEFCEIGKDCWIGSNSIIDDGVKIGDSIHISAIPLPEGVTPTITDRDFTVATLASPGGGVKNEDEEAEEEATEEEGEEE